MRQLLDGADDNSAPMPAMLRPLLIGSHLKDVLQAQPYRVTAHPNGTREEEYTNARVVFSEETPGMTVAYLDDAKLYVNERGYVYYEKRGNYWWSDSDRDGFVDTEGGGRYDATKTIAKEDAKQMQANFLAAVLEGQIAQDSGVTTPEPAPPFRIEKAKSSLTREQLRELEDNRRDPVGRQASDPRPVAIVCYPVADHNGAFNTASWLPLLKGYRVMYYEVRNERELAGAVADAARAGAPGVVWIGGHGSPQALQMGPDLVDGDLVDLGDEGELKDTFSALAPGAHIVLDSCMTALGRHRTENLVNMIGRAAKRAHVWGAELPTSSSTRAEVDGDGRFIGPGFRAFDDALLGAYHVFEGKPVGTPAWSQHSADVGMAG